MRQRGPQNQQTPAVSLEPDPTFLSKIVELARDIGSFILMATWYIFSLYAPDALFSAAGLVDEDKEGFRALLNLHKVSGALELRHLDPFIEGHPTLAILLVVVMALLLGVARRAYNSNSKKSGQQTITAKEKAGIMEQLGELDRKLEELEQEIKNLRESIEQGDDDDPVPVSVRPEKESGEAE